jgi:hypothetical protein
VGDKYYSRFLTFIQEEMKTKSWKAIINRYLFEGDDLAEDPIIRLFTREPKIFLAAFQLIFAVHLLIHLACGVEFEQPAIIAEVLALPCTHDKTIGDFLSKAERHTFSTGAGVNKSLVEVIQGINMDSKIQAISLLDEPRKLRNGPATEGRGGCVATC